MTAAHSLLRLYEYLQVGGPVPLWSISCVLAPQNFCKCLRAAVRLYTRFCYLKNDAQIFEIESKTTITHKITVLHWNHLHQGLQLRGRGSNRRSVRLEDYRP